MNTRRQFLRMMGCGTTAFVTGLPRCGKAVQSVSSDLGKSAAVPPNIIFILADDLGSWDLNVYGSKDLITPNIDRLAADGVRFTQFYVMASVCAPSRGALLTGRYPWRNGVQDNGSSFHNGEVTMARALQGAGYHTGLVGKWHLGQPGPRAFGFDEFFGFLGGCINNYDHSCYNWDAGTNPQHDLWRNETEIHEEGLHFGELMVREATRFIEENKQRPFFLYVAFNNPHYPMQPMPEFTKPYTKLKEQRRSYAAFVTTMDDQLRRILATVAEHGLRRKTIIIFHSDNGKSNERRNTFWIKDPDLAEYGGGNSGPYRGGKFDAWEGGLRLPCIISWPGQIPAGEVRDQAVLSMDWMPTLLGYCGVKQPANSLDGTDIATVIASANAPSPKRVMHWGWGKGTTWAIRENSWKLVHQKDQLFLSDIEKDVSETKNLAEKNPEIVKRLTQLHVEWAAQFTPKTRTKKLKKGTDQ